MLWPLPLCIPTEYVCRLARGGGATPRVLRCQLSPPLRTGQAIQGLH